jgi:P27 family predicted phage terminase small subunit
MPARRSPDRKALSGTLRRDRMPRNPGARLLRLPRAPARLTEAARSHWHRVGKMAVSAGILRGTDLELLALLAEALATVEDAQSKLVVGVLITSRGAVKANPAIHVLRDARAVAIRALCEMGLTPRARVSVDADQGISRKALVDDRAGLIVDDDQDDLESYLARNPSRGHA